MATRRRPHLTRLLPLVVVALALLLAAPAGAAAAPAGGAVQVAIPGVVSLMAYLVAGLVLLGLAVARHRPTV